MIYRIFMSTDNRKQTIKYNKYNKYSKLKICKENRNSFQYNGI